MTSRALAIYNSLRAHVVGGIFETKREDEGKEEAHLYISNKWTHSHPGFFFLLLRERDLFSPSLYVFIIGALLVVSLETCVPEPSPLICRKSVPDRASVLKFLISE